MKVGIVYQPRPRWPKFAWVHQALARLGHSVYHAQSCEGLAYVDVWADVVLFEQRSPFSPKELARFHRSGESVWACWWFDLIQRESVPLEDQPTIRSGGNMLRAMDVVALKEKENIPRYRDMGIEAIHLDQGACSTAFPCEHNGKSEFDVLVFGSKSGKFKQRHADVRTLLDAGMSVAWAGDQGSVPRGAVDLPWTHSECLPDLMSRSAVVLHVDYRHDVPHYWSDRLWMAAGSGACVVKRKTKGDPVACCRSYESNDELVGMVRGLVGSPILRKQVGSMVRKVALGANTYEHRLNELFDECKKRMPAVQGQEDSRREGSRQEAMSVVP